MTQTNNIVAKLAVAFVAVAMAFSLVAPAAQAQDVSSMSLEQLIALVNSLQTELSGSVTGNCAFTFTRSLGQGTSGADVMNLQKFLNMDPDLVVALSGAGSPGMETSFYGSLTAAAVSKFQTKYSADVLVPVGLTSPTGYFGPSSMAKANALCSSMGGGSTGGSTGGTTSGALKGGAGSIQDVDFISSLNNEEVGEGDEDVEVAGLEIEADDGSDIELTAVTLNFSAVSVTSGQKLDDYADEISVWFDGEEVARMDVDEFDEDDNYSKTISLDNGAIIRAGETGELVVAISAVSGLDSADAGDTWNVSFTSVRFRDAQNASITDSSTGDIDDSANNDTTTDSDERGFSFETFATASDLEFKVSKGDADINDARSIAVSSTTETDNVEILSFEIEVEGNSDVNVDDIAVDFGTSTGDLLSDLITGAELVVDGEVIGSETITTAYNDDGVVVFDGLDWDIDAGDTVEVIVRVDMNELNTGTFAAGATLSASVDPDNSNWDVEDEEGDAVGASDKSGTATSDAHVFYGDGIQVVQSSVSEVNSTIDGDNNDYTTLTIKFDVTAYGEDAYIPNVITNTVASSSLVTTAPSTSEGVGIALNSNDDDINATGTVSVTLTSTADEETNSFKVADGETETFTAKIVVVNGTGGGLDAASVRAILTGVGFADTDSAASDSVFTANVTDIKTDYGYIAN